jgi:2-polyprenyl-3-methyl-5-hydroxy-6-metoxy-1,4-benzoquinol methylase
MPRGEAERSPADQTAPAEQLQQRTEARLAKAVQAFEEAVLAQRAIRPEHYDEEYFTSGWREGGNRYDLESRRAAEGHHPALIKDVFEPARVLDVGCGPGFLMYLLHEIGVEADGVDFSAHSRSLAPEEIRERITLGAVTEQHVPEQSYDLVISREVLEHLTVLQLRAAVTQLCRASSRFVYATARFHPNARGLLDFTTQFDVDPSHVTLLAKPFLRCLFVLEGFRSRPDLEQRMDWAGKGRVLVYQRHARDG